MGRRGPIPKPAHLKILEGNPGNRPIETSLKPAPVAPECPSWLDKTAKKEWNRVVPELEKLGLISQLDRTALAIYCQSYSQLVACEKALAKEELTYETPSGQKKPNPYIAIIRDLKTTIRQYLSEFGLTPSSRSRMSISGETDDDDDFFD